MSEIVATIALLVVLAGGAAILLGLIACCTNANDTPAESQALLNANTNLPAAPDPVQAKASEVPPLYSAVV